VKPRILCLDIEGGHGGSSRSLFQALQHIDRRKVSLEVWHRIPGEIERSYADIGIPTVLAKDMPRLTALEKESRNALNVAMFFLHVWPRSAPFRTKLLEALDRSDLVHLNHISLFWLGRWIKRLRPSLPIVMHIRTCPYPTSVGFWQQRTAARFCDGMVYITENEKKFFENAAGTEPPNVVLYNPVVVRDRVETKPAFRFPAERLVATVLSNYSFNRGIDRLIEVAKRLDSLGDTSVLFAIAGDMRVTGAPEGKLAAVARQNGTLKDYARDEGVAHRFKFFGHISNPEDLLSKSHALLKPTRENNPWGRDILEALAHSVPVASVGIYDRFVETGETGLLQKTFDPDELALWLMHLSTDPAEGNRLGENARTRIQRLCDPTAQAAALSDYWCRLIHSKT